MDIFGWVIVWVICAFIAGGMSSSKGRSYGEGFFIGLLLGIVGVIIVAVLPKNEQGLEQEKLRNGIGKRCPYCAEIIKREATVCRFCGKELPTTALSVGEIQITKGEFSKLTYRQKYAVTEFGYLLSSEDAEIVGKMLGNFQGNDIPAFCEANGKKVSNLEA